jgi:hypothetical protein
MQNVDQASCYEVREQGSGLTGSSVARAEISPCLAHWLSRGTDVLYR